MIVQPGVQVKPVINAATTKTNFWHIQLSQQRDPDAEVNSRLFFGQTTNRGQRQTYFIHDGVLP
jgi:hypothetical protein